MGLVVELPPATLQPLDAAAGTPAGVPGAGGLFAALLSAVAVPAPGSGESEAQLSAPATPRREETAALQGLAALALVPALAPALNPQQPAPAGTPASPGSVAGPDASACAAEAGPVVPSLPAAVEPPAGGDAPLDPVATAAVEEASSAELPAAEASADALPLAPATPQDAPAADPQARAPGDAPPGPSEPSPPPGGAPGEGQHSVVRSVGNASDAPAGLPAAAETAAPHARPAEGRPAPRASETAIAHAAPHSAVGQLREAGAAPEAPAAAPAPPPDAPAAPAQVENLDAVATAVIERAEADGGEARIHLEPAGLGEITIRLHARHEAVHLDIRAETPEAAQLLRDAAADLSSLLGQRGMNLAGLNIGLGARQGGGADAWYEPAPARPTAEPGEFAAILGIDDPAAAARDRRLRAAYNPDGALIYRV
ncbi:MAG: hypothetical protein KatS3mg062_0987 [Tepidiforma sp.]|nr:MAG: hypothetical protein KatS3mg062_0987 [Tepidiforma sp.]